MINNGYFNGYFNGNNHGIKTSMLGYIYISIYILYITDITLTTMVNHIHKPFTGTALPSSLARFFFRMSHSAWFISPFLN